VPCAVATTGLVFCILAAAAVAAGNAHVRAAAGPAPAATVVVTAGKPAELAFRLSRSTGLPVGTITFRVNNAGRRPHAFKICTTPGGGAAAGSCAGRATKVLAPGGSATLRVAFRQGGRYRFLSTVPGQAAAGMTGTLVVTAPAAAAPSSAAAAPAPPPASAPAPRIDGPSGSPCASPQATTVLVTAFEFGFTLSQTTVPCGPVTFVLTDAGTILHNFNVSNLFSSRGGIIGPGESIRATQNFLPGSYQYYCDVTGHIAFGMVGTLTVTG
jgi:plastocyanin